MRGDWVNGQFCNNPGCGHDRLLHDDLAGPCLILDLTTVAAIGCGCMHYEPAPAAPRVPKGHR